MKDTLILKNGTIIELEASARLGALQVEAKDRAAMVATWEQMQPENLAVVQIKNGDGLVAWNYTNLVLVSETSIVATDGSVLTTYNMRKKTDGEKRLEALEEGQAVQDGAINDLGETIGTLSEGGAV